LARIRKVLGLFLLLLARIREVLGLFLLFWEAKQEGFRLVSPLLGG